MSSEGRVQDALSTDIWSMTMSMTLSLARACSTSPAFKASKAPAANGPTRDRCSNQARALICWTIPTPGAEEAISSCISLSSTADMSAGEETRAF